MIREKIEQEMKAQRISQRDLATKSNMTESQISRFLSGKSSIKMETIESIFKALDIQLMKIL